MWPDQTKSRVLEFDGLGASTQTVAATADDSITSEPRFDTSFDKHDGGGSMSGTAGRVTSRASIRRGGAARRW